ncbi:telomere-binding protein 1-like isoform X2 [Phragmites australis]|uniref:telomere-binding protein 1-like isoform X2 n=1 Tax=Phragmites australis TaxID=29695 RepID=UPI002D7755BA|nr:telomere-binding protein 1-like isoform X2 [Phragmites australis]
MVVRKRLDYGSRGHQVPTMPRVPNSARGKRSTRRKKNEMYAFDLLATVAGTLLADQDSSSNAPNINGAVPCYAKNRKSVKEAHFDEMLPPKNLAMEKDRCNVCVVGSGDVPAFPRQANACLEENSSTRNETDSVLESLTVKSNMLVRDSLVSCTRSCELSRDLGIIPEYGAFGVSHPGSTNSAEAEQGQQAEQKVIRSQADGHATALYSLFNSVDLDGRPPALVSSDSSSGVPLCSHDKEHKTSSFCQGEVQHTAARDDDENSSGCTHPSTTGNKGYKPHYLGDHRIRKLFASKVRKTAHNKIRGGMSNKGSRLNFCGKKISTTHQKVQRTFFKRKKLAQHQFTASFAKGMLSEVKLRIKSFNIPELLIEIPENATVGSLKRSVMNVVTSIMEGGLHVGVLIQGKNIQDDNKTLRQIGICRAEKLNNIDFTLEYEAGQDSPSGVIVPEEMDFPNADIVEPLARMKCEEPFPETNFGDDNQQPMHAYPNCSLTGPGSVHRPVDMGSQDTSASSQAIIPTAPADFGSLAIAPLCKSKRSDIGQRRIRRPFSVAEVEALVEAVEQLGTGRWRDVKMRAFDNADHRTYVDLKDKWKTLVHTASISPQQRRGQPLPQELLDRVLSAQAYWSQQHARLQDKPPGKAPPVLEICLG